MNFLLVFLNCTNNVEAFPAVSGLLHRHIRHPAYPEPSTVGYVELFIKAIQKLKIHRISPNTEAFKAIDSGSALRLQLIKLERNLENDESKQCTETQ